MDNNDLQSTNSSSILYQGDNGVTIVNVVSMEQNFYKVGISWPEIKG
jgi:hypothetical protein